MRLYRTVLAQSDDRLGACVTLASVLRLLPRFDLNGRLELRCLHQLKVQAEGHEALRQVRASLGNGTQSKQRVPRGESESAWALASRSVPAAAVCLDLDLVEQLSMMVERMCEHSIESSTHVCEVASGLGGDGVTESDTQTDRRAQARSAPHSRRSRKSSGGARGRRTGDLTGRTVQLPHAGCCCPSRPPAVACQLTPRALLPSTGRCCCVVRVPYRFGKSSCEFMSALNPASVCSIQSIAQHSLGAIFFPGSAGCAAQRNTH